MALAGGGTAVVGRGLSAGRPFTELGLSAGRPLTGLGLSAERRWLGPVGGTERGAPIEWS
ncbi:predicted protein [Streptomyces sp. AA4]|nr:predicted protein [Streptomyces sp. AA4]